MTPFEHVGDLAELYALGAVEPDERIQVDAHIATCPACERSVGRAEEAVATLDDLSVPLVMPPDRLGRRIAAAARVGGSRRRVTMGLQRWAVLAPQRWVALVAGIALVIGIGGGISFDRMIASRGGQGGDDRALERIATSHFRHTNFVARQAGSPIAKVLYARDGAWLYVVVDATVCDCRIVARSSGGARNLGFVHEHGSIKTLFSDDARHPSALDLIDSGQVVAAATLVY